MTDDELLGLPGTPDYPGKTGDKVRSCERDLKAAIEECLSKYVAEASYDDAKRTLEGCQDAFDYMAGLVDDLENACRALDDHAVVMYGCAYDVLCRVAPDWREEVMVEKVAELA